MAERDETKLFQVFLASIGDDHFSRALVRDPRPIGCEGVDGKTGDEPAVVQSRTRTSSVDLLVTGHLPGRGKSAPFPFPDPTAASEEINGTRVVTLPQLIQLKLAAGRYSDFGDVVFLIRVHHLDESFLDRLHPAVHGDYIECLEEQRREDEYEARDQAD